jgi:glutamate-5-semialdehyde dehydrogenase
MQEIINKIIHTKQAADELLNLTDNDISKILNQLSNEIIAKTSEIIIENKKDLELFLKTKSITDSMYDRLLLNESRIKSIASQIKEIADNNFSCDDNIIYKKTLKNQIELTKLSVPFGVIAVIYEARPNVTLDVFSLCFKTQNAAILKGGREANNTNQIFITIIKNILKQNNVNENVVNYISCNHEETIYLLEQDKYIDLCIPRGGKKLIEFVRKNAKMLTLETGAGVVNLYLSAFANNEMASILIENSKTRRVSVCNALDCVIAHQSKLKDLPLITKALEKNNVLLYCDEKSYEALNGKYPFIGKLTEDEIGMEFLSYKMAIVTVSTIEEAINYINQNTSHHSECIVTENDEEVKLFTKLIDSSVIYHNTSTAFTDGGEFDMCGEIGISTQKLHARGPVSLDGLRTTKYFAKSRGIIRKVS